MHHLRDGKERHDVDRGISGGAHLVQLLSGRWTQTVLTELIHGGRRYQDLHDAIDGISHKVLTDTCVGLSEMA